MFHDRLRSTRIYRKKTQQQMADLLDIKLRNYQKYEEQATTPSLKNLIILADALDTSVDFLLGRDQFLDSLGISIDVPLNVRPRSSRSQSINKKSIQDR